MSLLPSYLVLLPYLLAAGASGVVAAILWRDREARPGRGPFAVLLACVAGWSLTAFVEEASGLDQVGLAAANLEYVFIGAIPVMFLQFARRLPSEPTPVRRRPFAELLLWVVPAATAVLVWVDPSLIRTLHPRAYGPAFWVFAVYSFSLIAVALGLWGRFLVRQWGRPRWQETLPVVFVVLTWLSSLLVIAGANPWPGHHPTPVLFALVGLVVGLSLRRNRVFTLIPEAQRTLVQSWPTPVLIGDPEGRLQYANARAAEVWGLKAEAFGRPLDQAQPWFAPVLPAEDRGTLRLHDPDRKHTWQVNLQPLGRRRRAGTLMIFQDITDHHREVSEHSSALEQAYSELNRAQDSHRRNEEQIFYYSLHDSLTGLANRSLLLSRLGQAIELLRSDRRTGYSLVGLDLVNFRGVNDALGYGAGDDLVRQLAVRLTATLRESDVGARITADRFYALLNGATDLGAVLGAVERLREALEAALVLGGSSYLPRFRFSVVVGDPAATSPEAVIDDAETALSRAKEEGADEVQVFQRSWRELRRENRVLLEDLSRAFSTRQIRLAYQPIVDTPTGRLAGIEALIRWDHPTQGPIDPARMISLAESEGLIAPLGLWALREATGFLSRVRKTSPALEGLFVSVNVSPKQLRDPDFDSLVLAILESTGLPPAHLHLEITESSVVVHKDQVIPHLESLRRRGVKIMLDDFGTGYSSLQALHDLPVDTLKIDRAFIENLPQSRPIIASVLDLTRTLGLESVAEGVETPAQLDQLRGLGCTHIQGYLFSKAVSETDFAALVRGAGDDLVLGPRPEDLPEL